MPDRENILAPYLANAGGFLGFEFEFEFGHGSAGNMRALALRGRPPNIVLSDRY